MITVLNKMATDFYKYLPTVHICIRKRKTQDNKILLMKKYYIVC